MLVERISEARLAIIERVEEIFTEPMSGASGNVRCAQGLRALCAECELRAAKSGEKPGNKPGEALRHRLAGVGGARLMEA